MKYLPFPVLTGLLTAWLVPTFAHPLIPHTVAALDAVMPVWVVMLCLAMLVTTLSEENPWFDWALVVVPVIYCAAAISQGISFWGSTMFLAMTLVLFFIVAAFAERMLKLTGRLFARDQKMFLPV